MYHYRAPDGSIHALDDARDAFRLPAGSQPISAAEVAAIPKPQPPVQAQIEALERQELMPRALRDHLLEAYAEKGKTSDPAYLKVKALDDQIAELRAKR